MPVHRSLWLEESVRAEPFAPLETNEVFDVAIVGGGYVGLWTAIKILQKAPGTEVCVLERDICGGGASGRNGGFVLSWWPKIASLQSLFGDRDALGVARDSEGAIGQIAQFCAQHQMDVHFRRGGWLWTATSSAQMNSWSGVLSACERLGVRDVFEVQTPEQVSARTGSASHRAGVLDTTAATLHPGHLVRGLRRVASELGVRIYENTCVKKFSRSSPIRVDTEQASITCAKLVIANNAWAAGIEELSRSIIAITSDMIASEPAKQQLESIGWTGGECVTDSQMMVDYYHVTSSHRVAFGKGGWGIAYGGRIGPGFDRNPKRAEMVEADFRRYYPQLAEVKVTHDWSGPIDRTPNSLPLLGNLRTNPNILYGVGWSGNGVGPSFIGGEALSSLALDADDKWANYPLINKSVGGFPPEPIRICAAHLVRAAVRRKERAEIQDRRPGFLANQLAKLAPAGLEDKD
jgi:glycine/D-amino acid oxidase-like deaminating enzyme